MFWQKTLQLKFLLVLKIKFYILGVSEPHASAGGTYSST